MKHLPFCLAILVAFTAQAAVPSYQNFDTNDFIISGQTITSRRSVLTNIVASAMTTSNMLYIDKAGTTNGIIHRRDRPWIHPTNALPFITNNTTVSISPGTYDFASKAQPITAICTNLANSAAFVLTNRTSVHFKGEGQGVVFKGLTNGVIMMLHNCTDIFFENITFEGNHPFTNFTTTSGIGVAVSGSRVRFFNCRFQKLEDHCIATIFDQSCQLTSDVYVDNCTFVNWGCTNCSFNTLDGAGIVVRSTEVLNVVNSYFSNGVVGIEIEGHNDTTLNQHGVYVNNNSFINMVKNGFAAYGEAESLWTNRMHWVVRDNYFRQDKAASSLYRPIALSHGANAIIEGNTILEAPLEGIRIEAAQSSRFITIRRNYIEGALLGIGVYQTSGDATDFLEGVTIDNNYLYLTDGWSIDFTGSGSRIQNNFIYNGTQDPTTAGGAIRLRDLGGGPYTNNVVSGNQFDNITGTNLAIGLRIEANYVNTRVENNIPWRGVVTPIVNLGTGTTAKWMDSSSIGFNTNAPVATAEIFSTDADGALKITGPHGTSALVETNGNITAQSFTGNGPAPGLLVLRNSNLLGAVAFTHTGSQNSSNVFDFGGISNLVAGQVLKVHSVVGNVVRLTNDTDSAGSSGIATNNGTGWGTTINTLTNAPITISDVALKILIPAAQSTNAVEVYSNGVPIAVISSNGTFATITGNNGGYGFVGDATAKVYSRLAGIITFLAGNTLMGEMVSTGLRLGTGTLGFGAAATANDVTIGREGAGIIQYGADGAIPVTYTNKSGDGSGTDISGASLILQGGRSTGTGTPGRVKVQSGTNNTVSGTGANPYSTPVSVGGTLFSDTTQSDTDDASEKTLYTATIPAGQLAVNQDRLYVEATGRFAATAETKNVRVKFGGTTVFTTGDVAFNNGEWVLSGTIWRTSATAQKAAFRLVASGFSTTAYADYSTPAETLAGTVALVITGDAGAGAADAEIIYEASSIEWKPAP